jgi:hypothetical protein
VELGAALAARKVREREVPGPPLEGEGWPRIYVSGPKWARTIFTSIADRTFEADSDACSLIVAQGHR